MEIKNGHYYKYFTTRPNIGNPTTSDAVSWDENRRRAVNDFGGMRGYLVHIVMCMKIIL